ncbi:MAG: cell division protein SepF [Thermoplasmata archaeon]
MLFKKKQDKKPTDDKIKFIDLANITIPNDIEDQKIVKVAEIYTYEDMIEALKYSYDGNILLLDISGVSDDLNEKKIIDKSINVSKEINGDTAKIAKNMIMITPSGIKIDRDKFRGNLSL